MARIYQLMIDERQIGDIYYNEHDAIDNAEYLARDLNETVAIWEAEEVEGLDAELLDWAISMVVGVRWTI